MTTRREDTAAWIRDHAWTLAMRKLFAAVPGHYLKCACQCGIADWCKNDQHGRCARGEPLPLWETAILKHGGTHPAIGVSEVWLADRICVWRCKCGCHEPPAERTDKPVQLGLFDALTT